MDFQNFSLLIQHTKVGGFADGLEKGELRASRCAGCGRLAYPPRSDCPDCFSDAFTWAPLEGTGRLASFTQIFVTPAHFTPDFSGTAPFSRYAYQPRPVGILEIEGGLRIMGWIVGAAAGELEVGMQLTARPETLDDGRVTVVLEKAEG
jgi:hypothetical protein